MLKYTFSILGIRRVKSEREKTEFVNQNNLRYLCFLLLIVLKLDGADQGARPRPNQGSNP